MYKQWREDRNYNHIISYVTSQNTDELTFEDYYQHLFALNRLNKFHQAKELAVNNFSITENIEPIEQLKFWYELLISSFQTGSYKEGKEYLEKTKKIIDTIDFDKLPGDLKTRYMSFYNHAGVINYAIQNYKEALDNYEKLIDLGEENDDAKIVLAGVINKAIILEIYGRYKEAIEQYYKARTIAEKIGRITSKITISNNLVSLLQHVGRIDESMDMANAGIVLANEHNNTLLLSKLLLNRSTNYRRRGEYKLAEQDLIESYQLKLDLKNNYELAILLYQFVTFYLDTGFRDKAMEKLREYKELYNSLEVKDMYYPLAEAMYLKSSNFYKHKLQSEEIFRDIIQQTQLGSELRLIASLQLLELLIEQVDEEVELNNLVGDEKETIQEEIMEMYNEILESQEVMESPLLAIQIHYIRAHLHIFFLQPELVEFELEKARKINEKIGVVNLNFKEPELNNQFLDALPTTLRGSLNKIIHSEPRLKIILALIKNPKLIFTELQEIIGLTPGNLGKHADKLVEVGYVNKSKEIVDDKFLTMYELTPEGINEFDKYKSLLTPYLQ